MAQLLAKSRSLTTVRKRDVMSGTITKLTPSEILVDVNAKTEAVVLEKDRTLLKTMLATLRVGDAVSVTVLNPEAETGNPVVSLRRFIDDALWEKLEAAQQNQEPLQVTIKEATRAGYLAESKLGIFGFLPYSQISPASLFAQQAGMDPIGATLEVLVLEFNRRLRRIIFSQKKMSEEEFGKAVANLSVGQKMSATVANVSPFGVSVVLQQGSPIDGFVHISEASWEGVPNLDAFSPGQTIECVVTLIDRQAKRVNLSIKRLTEDPFKEVAKKLTLEEKVLVRVVRTTSTAVYVVLPDGKTEGMIRKEKIPPNVSFVQGNEVEAIVSEIDEKRRRILLVPVLKAKPIGYR